MGSANKKQKAEEAKANEDKSQKPEMRAIKEPTSKEQQAIFDKAIDGMRRTKNLRLDAEEVIAERNRMSQAGTDLLVQTATLGTMTSLELKAKKLDVMSLKNSLFEDILPKALVLQQLVIMHCRLSEFPTPLPKGLKELVLSRNQITEINQMAIRPLTELETLDISYNNLTKLGQLISLKKLVRLYLSCNSIARIKSNALSGLENLLEIDLRKNALTELNFTLEDVPNLETLLLSKNNIHFLPSNFCSESNRLTVMKLNQNPLAALPENIGNLKMLYRIDLRSTKLKELPLSMGECEQLTKFSIGQIKLEGIDSIKRNFDDFKPIRESLRALSEAKRKRQMEENKSTSEVIAKTIFSVINTITPPPPTQPPEEVKQPIEKKAPPAEEQKDVKAVFKGFSMLAPIVRQKFENETDQMRAVREYLMALRNEDNAMVNELERLNVEEKSLTRRMLTLTSIKASVEAYLKDPRHPERSSLVSTSPYFVGRIGIYASATKLMTMAGFRLKDYHSKGLMYEVARSDGSEAVARTFLGRLSRYIELLTAVYHEEQLRSDYNF